MLSKLLTEKVTFSLQFTNSLLDTSVNLGFLVIKISLL